jgi:ADP-heptose:LPS heptosyltransferase
MLLKSHHDIIFDLGGGNEHISDWIRGFELSYGTYVGFCKSKTISNEIAVPVEPQTPIKANRADKEYAKLLIGQQNGTPLITFVPGAASSLRKRWPAEYFAELINRLNEHLTCQCLLLGDLSEVEIGDKIVKQQANGFTY